MNARPSSFNERFFLLVGLACIAIGLLANEWVLSALFSADGEISRVKILVIRSLNITFLVAGGALIAFRRRMSVQQIALALCSLLAGFGMMEWILQRAATEPQFRVFAENPNDTGSYRLMPNLDFAFSYAIDGEGRDFDIRTNDWGMRWRAITREKPEGVSRVAFLGDSFTFGESARTVEESFVGVFEDGLDRSRYEVLNFGVDGYGIDDMALLLQEEVLSFSPDVVFVMAFNGNDFRDTYLGLHKFDVGTGRAVWNEDVLQARIPPELRGGRFFGGGVGFRGEDSVRKSLRSRINSLQTVARVRQLIARFEKADKEEAGQPDYDPTTIVIEPYFTAFSFWSQDPQMDLHVQANELTCSALDTIKALCRENGIDLYLVAIPYLEQVHSRDMRGEDANGIGFDLSFPQSYLDDYAARNGIPYLDLLPALREHVRQTGEGLYPDLDRPGGDIHFDTRGHFVVGNMLLSFYEEHGGAGVSAEARVQARQAVAEDQALRDPVR